MQNLYQENLKVFMKVAKVNLTNWKVSPMFWTERLNIMYILSRLIYKINAVSIKIPTSYFIVLDELIKFIRNN